MDFSLLVLVLGFVFVAFLIFKLIKRVVVAFFSVFLIFVLLVCGIFGVIYYDLNNLSSSSELSFNLVYEKDDSYLFGLNLPFKNSNLVFENVSSLDEDFVENLNVSNLKNNKNDFVVVLEKKAFEEILEKSYDFSDFVYLNFTKVKEYDFKFSSFEVVEILESRNSEDIFLEILLDNNQIEGFQRNLLKSYFKKRFEIIEEENNLKFREMIFGFVLKSSFENKDSILSYLENFDEDRINIYPTRLSFKLLKIIPTSTLKSFIEKKFDF